MEHPLVVIEGKTFLPISYPAEGSMEFSLKDPPSASEEELRGIAVIMKGKALEGLGIPSVPEDSDPYWLADARENKDGAYCCFFQVNAHYADYSIWVQMRGVMPQELLKWITS